MERQPAVKKADTSQPLQPARQPAQLAGQESPSLQLLLQLQSTIGNQAMQKLLRSGAIQAKLKIGQPGDVYEQEADRMAERVMRMPEPMPIGLASSPIQRKCAECEEEEKEKIRAEPASPAQAVGELDAAVAQRMAGRGGAPLPQELRSYFEPRFGFDFSGVKIHADGEAADGARAVQARAYTIGRDIVFGSGEYSPATVEGKRLLAHELTHVVQQGGAVALQNVPALQSQEPMCAGEKIVSNPLSPFPTGMHLSRLQTWHGSRHHYAATKSAPGFEMESGAKRVGADSDQGLFILGCLASSLSLTPSPVAIHRAIETYCLAPSEVPSITQNQASSFGRIAEVPIVMDYCSATGGCALLVSDYIDTDAASYIAFLAAKNPHLTTQDIVELAIAATATGGVSRPDVLTHKPPRFEFEEVKPDSVTGRLAGRLKLLSLATLYARFSLPYLPGTTWPGTGSLPLFTLPGGVTVFLEWHRNLPGLVVYNICVRGEASVLAAYGILAILIAAILILLTRGRIIGGAPAPLPIPVLASSETPGTGGGPRHENEVPAAQGGGTELS